MREAASVAPSKAIDPVTLVGITLFVAATQFFLHEAVGHALVGYVLGMRPLVITATYVRSVDPSFDIAVNSARAIIAAGTLINLAIFGVAFFALTRRPPRSTATRMFLWCAAVHGYMAFGYMMTSIPLQAGDWAAFADTFGSGTTGFWITAVVVTGVGFWGYVRMVPRVMGRELDAFVGTGPDRRRRAWLSSLAPYACSILVGVSAAARAPDAGAINNGIAASVFGLIGFVFLPLNMKKPSEAASDRPLGVAPARWWLALGIAALLAMILVVGPGIVVG
jgi:hypothetical protein